MKRLQLASLTALVLCATCFAPSVADSRYTTPSATSATTGVTIADAAPDFGQPPSGEVPILYNDHHVYAKPDILKQERVLAALVKGNTIYVPLRSMFEQMGATVTASPGGKTVTAKKTGVTVSVTLGKNEVVINGESRPLDVPPMLYKGVVLVPVRVISEALGAYVQWVPSQRVVVVRYLPPTPVPTAPPTIAPTPPPTPTPTPVPATPRPQLGFIQGGVSSSRTYNEFAAGEHSVGASYVGKAGIYAGNFAFVADGRQDTFETTANAFGRGCQQVSDLGGAKCPDTTTPFTRAQVVAMPCISAFFAPVGSPWTQFSTLDGGTSCTPQFRARQNNLDIRAEYRLSDRYQRSGSSLGDYAIGAGYIIANNNWGYPELHGIGVGLEKLPNQHHQFDIYGSVFYYPSASGTYVEQSFYQTIPALGSPFDGTQVPNFGAQYKVQYGIIKSDVDVSYTFGESPFYIFAEYSGDRYTKNGSSTAPVAQTHSGGSLGLGIHF